MIKSFDYTTRAQHVVFAPGVLQRLDSLLQEAGWQRALLCTIPRFRASGLAQRVQDLLGPRLVASYDQAQPHVPQHQVQEATALANEHQVDAVIGLGGGSPIGLAKAVAHAVQPALPIIAIPTTYSGSEMTPIYGVTRPQNGGTRKVTVTDPAVAPSLTIYDPELTIPLPPQMTASSAMNALAHCVEAVYSITRNPLATAAALQGIRHITRALPAAVSHGEDLDARTELFLGAHLAAISVSMTKIGLHHGLCHVLGGSAGVPHGIANAIMLSHAMRFNADATARELAAVAHALGIQAADGDSNYDLALKAADAVQQLVAQSGLPQRLRDVGVPEEALTTLARLALKSKAVQNNPKPVTSAQQTEAVYRAAW